VYTKLILQSNDFTEYGQRRGPKIDIKSIMIKH